MSREYIGLKNLDVGYGGKAIIEDICLSIRKGDIVTLIGPNGAGKSTILKSISKHLEIVGGKAVLDGSSIKAMPYKELASKMAVVLTERLRTELMTCHDIVATGRYPYTGRLGILSPDDEEKVDRALSLVNAEDLGDRDFARISDGQRQRVLLARAICQEPEVILLDEPTSFLDIKYKLELLGILREMSREKGITVVMSLHEIELARKISDKIICVGEGEIQGYGTPDEIFTRDVITKLFSLDHDSYDELFGREFGRSSSHEENTGRSGAEGRFTVRGGRKLRRGYTTGTCAAAAAKASAELLLGGMLPESVRITAPAGTELFLEPVSSQSGEGWASCGIVKDAGDDPDITDGITVFAKVERQMGDETCDSESEGRNQEALCKVNIKGGEGVGRVTRKGLEQPVGEAAINSVPRNMIEKSVRETSLKYGYTGELDVTIYVPGGREIGAKTFNPNLGIEGGISILGTTGIVEPMSEAALIDTIDIEIRQKIAEGMKNLVVTPGNYGHDYLAGMDEGESLASCSIKSSNYIGETIDRAINHGASGILFVAHIGKFIKVAGGIMNTHSRNGDCRAELMASCALRAGAEMETVSRVLETVTTDEAIEILEGAGLRDKTMEVVAERIHYYLEKRSMGKIKTEALIFSNAHGYLGETAGFRAYLEQVRKELQNG